MRKPHFFGFSNTYTLQRQGGNWIIFECHHPPPHHHQCQRKRAGRLVCMERKITQKGNRTFKGKIWDLSLNTMLCSNFLGPPGFLQALEHWAKDLFWWLSLTYANRLKAFPRLLNVLTKLTYEWQFIFINIWSLIVQMILMMTAYWWAKLYTRLECELGRGSHPEDAMPGDDSGCGWVPPFILWQTVSISLSHCLPGTSYCSSFFPRFLLSPAPHLHPENDLYLTGIISG